MKTPDEIKKGLECCNGKWVGNHFRGCDSECPYYSEQPFCKNVRNHDTLAYIQQLETKCHQLERERDDLLKDLRATDPCDNCKHCGDNCKGCEEDEHWEWRGIKEDNR